MAAGVGLRIGTTAWVFGLLLQLYVSALFVM